VSDTNVLASDADLAIVERLRAGAPSPLETQNIMVSTSAQNSATSVPLATAALKIRAPSRCTGTPAS
jgi:hypothetical protein